LFFFLCLKRFAAVDVFFKHNNAPKNNGPVEIFESAECMQIMRQIKRGNLRVSALFASRPFSSSVFYAAPTSLLTSTAAQSFRHKKNEKAFCRLTCRSEPTAELKVSLIRIISRVDLAKSVSMNAVITETIIATILGLGMQIHEIPVKRI